MAKKYRLKKVAYSGLALGVVTTSLVPNMVLAQQTISEESDYDNVGYEVMPEAEEYKVPKVTGYELEGDLEKLSGKTNLYAPKSDLHLKLKLENKENIAELKIIEDGVSIYSTSNVEDMSDIVLSKYLTDATKNKSVVTDLGVEYRISWRDTNGKEQSVIMVGDLRDKKLVYDADVSSVKYTFDATNVSSVAYSSLDTVPYYKYSGTGKISIMTTNTNDDIKKAVVTVNGGTKQDLVKDSDDKFKLDLDMSKIDEPKDRIYHLSSVITTKAGDDKTLSRDLKITKVDPTFDFEMKSTDGVVQGDKKAIIGKAGQGYSIHFDVVEKDIPVELDRIELWKNGQKVKFASVVKEGDKWVSDDLEVGAGTYEVKLVSDTDWVTTLGSVEVVEDTTAPTITDVFVPEVTTDGKDWVVGKPEIPITITDDNGLHSIEVKVNGASVYSQDLSDVGTSYSDTLRGALFKPDKDGKVKIEYIVHDKFNNKTTKVREFYVTDVRPSIVDAVDASKGVKQVVFGNDLFAGNDVMLSIKTKNASSIMVTNSSTGVSTTLDSLTTLVSLKGFDRIKALNDVGISSDEYKLLKLYKDLEGVFIVDDTRPTGVLKGLDLPNGKDWFASKPTGVSLAVVDDKAIKRVKIKANGIAVVDEDVSKVGSAYVKTKDFPIDLTNTQISVDGSIKFDVEIEDMIGSTTFSKTIKVDVDGFNTSKLRMTADKPYKVYDSGVYFKEVPSTYTYTGLANLSGVKKYRVADTVDNLKNATWKTVVGKIPYTDGTQVVQFEDDLGRVSDVITIASVLEEDGNVNNKALRVYVDTTKSVVEFDNTSVTKSIGSTTWITGEPKIKAKVKDNLHLAGYEVYLNGDKVLDKRNEFLGTTKSEEPFDLSSLIKKYVEETGRSDVRLEVRSYDKAGNETIKVDDLKIDLGDVKAGYEGLGDGINDKANKRYHIAKPYKIKLNNIKSASGIAKVLFYDKNGDIIATIPYEDGKEIEVPVGAVGYKLESKLGVVGDKVDLFEGSALVIDTVAPKLVVKVTDTKYTEGEKDWYAAIPNVLVEGTDEENLSELKIITPKGEQLKTEYGLEKTTGEVKVKFDGLEDSRGKKITYEGVEYGSEDANAYNFLYVVRDKVGHQTIQVGTYYVDNEKPKVRGVVSGKPFEFGDNLFYVDEFRAKLNVVSASGIKSVTIGGKDFDLNGDFVRTEEFANDDVVVTNKLGVVTTLKLYEVLGLSGKNIYVDREAPKVEYGINGVGAYTDARGRLWFSDMKDFKVNLTDDKAVGNYVVKVNGVVVRDKTVDDVVGRVNDVIDFSKIQKALDGTYTIETSVVDKAGRETKEIKVVYVDHILPDIKGIRLGDTKITAYKDYGYFVKGSSLKILGYDLQTPLTGATLYRDGNKVEIKEGTYAFTNNSKYVYKDNLGRSSKEYTFAELVGLDKADKDVFVYDTEAPKGDVKNVTTTNGANEVKEYEDSNGLKWTGSMKYLGVDVSDDKGLHKVRVELDGKEVYNKTIDGKLKHSDVIDLEKEVGKLSDGRHTVVYKVEDMAGYTYESSKVWYLDTQAPEIKGFEFIQEGYKEGSTLTTDFDKYGFFFSTGTDVKVYVEDVGDSSGLDEVEVVLREAETGKEEVKRAKINGGIAIVDVPIDFKGWVSAKARDNIGNVSGLRGADGVVTESKNWNVRTSKVELTLPETSYRTINGLPLYSGSITVGGAFSQSVAGIRGINWSVDGANVGTDWSRGSQDKNLVVTGSSVMTVGGDSQEHIVNLGVTDNVGYLTEDVTRFAIDTTAPVISVSYDNNSANGNYYGSGRIATITIVEKNFNPADVRLRGVSTALSWSSNGDVHTATVPFLEDGNYNWGIDYTDMAGNIGQGYSSGDFVVDRTAPVVDVSWDNNDARNGNYYKGVRTATVTVRERNFDSSRFNISGGSLQGWSSNGDVHTARVVFGEGEHKLTVSGSDLAGNSSNSYDSGNFIVDMTSPELGITGVSDGASYDGDLLPVITFSDKYINSGSVRVTLRGQRNGTIELKGSVADGRFYVENLPKEAKYDDYYTLTAHIEDMAGNTVEKSVTFYVNRFGASFSFGSKDNVAKYYKELNEDIELTVTSVTPLDIDKFEYTVQLDGQVKEVKKPRVVESRDARGNYVYKIIFDKDNFKENGVWGVSVKTVDKFGKVSDSGTVKMNFVVDNIKPNIVVVGIEDNQFIEANRHKATVKVTDNVHVEDVKVYINGVERSFNADDIKRGSMDIFLDSSEKPYVVKVVATDLSGNKAEHTVKDFYVSTSGYLKFKSSVWFKVVLGLVGILGAVITFLVARWMYLTTKRRREEDKALDGTLNVDNEKTDKE